MVWLSESDIRTDEVREWKGVHLLHFQGSSCSQKTRIFLRLKGIDWESHHVNLAAGEHHTEWFMGINPRGLVPVLVHDGEVMIESNDILAHLETCFPDPPLLPRDDAQAVQLLEQEDDLHLDLRAISFRYFFPGVVPRPQTSIERYRMLGTGTVGGQIDPHKSVEVEFFEDMLANNGISDAQIVRAVRRFRIALDDLEQRLASGPFLLGEQISIVDIAWYIYAYRLITAGYPLTELHPLLGEWFESLHERDAFRHEIEEGGALVQARQAAHALDREAGTTLVDVAGLTGRG